MNCKADCLEASRFMDAEIWTKISFQAILDVLYQVTLHGPDSMIQIFLISPGKLYTVSKRCQN